MRAHLLGDLILVRSGGIFTPMEARLAGSEEGRRQIFEVHLREKPLEPGIERDSLAARTEGFSGAEIQAVCTRAALRAVRRVIAVVDTGPFQPDQLVIEGSDLDAAIQEVEQR